MFGNPETTPGGRALKFYSSIRLEIRKSEALKDGNDITGSKAKIKVVKNKVAPPFKQVEVDIIFGEGISKIGEILDISTELEYVSKAGAWYAYQGEKIGQGRDNAKKFLLDNPKVAKILEDKILEHYHIVY
jgi:recombination protein RecA